MRVRQISGTGCLIIAIILIVILSLAFRVAWAIFSSPIGLIAIAVGLFLLWKKRPPTKQSIEYEVIEDDTVQEVPDDVTVFPDDKNS